MFFFKDRIFQTFNTDNFQTVIKKNISFNGLQNKFSKRYRSVATKFRLCMIAYFLPEYVHIPVI